MALHYVRYNTATGRFESAPDPSSGGTPPVVEEVDTATGGQSFVDVNKATFDAFTVMEVYVSGGLVRENGGGSYDYVRNVARNSIDFNSSLPDATWVRIKMYNPVSDSVAGIPQARLITHLKADAGTFTDLAMTTPAVNDDDAVMAWADQSGQGNHASVLSETSPPTLKLSGRNSMPALVFADGDPMTFANVQTLSECDIFALFKNDDITNGSMVLSSVSPGNSYVYWGIPNPTPAVAFYPHNAVGGNDSGADVNVNLGDASKPNLANASLTPTTVSLGLNENAQFDEATADQKVTLELIGGNNPYQSNGDLYEIIVYDRKLSPAEKLRVWNYLNAKYALSGA